MLFSFGGVRRGREGREGGGGVSAEPQSALLGGDPGGCCICGINRDF